MSRHILATYLIAAILFLPPNVLAKEDNILSKIKNLEERIKELEKESNENKLKEFENSNTTNTNTISAFNPYMSIVLNGRYSDFQRKDNQIKGFQIGEEGERGDEGFSLGESEINLGANIDDKFIANITTAVVSEDGEDKLEFEEAFVQTSALPYQFTLTFGRLKPIFGYLNEKHTHTDEFANRPLPYRVFLNNSYNDDGMQISKVMPTSFYSEIGGGVYKGSHFPSQYEDSCDLSYNSFIKFGNDISVSQEWLGGISYLHANSNGNRETDDISFKGDDNLYNAFLKYTYSPNGNNKEKEFSLLGEYIFRDENGNYQIEELENSTFNNNTKGFYVQGTYKFLTNYKVGYQYSKLFGDNVNDDLKDTVLDYQNHNPEIHSIMTSWQNSEFSQIRLQYNLDKSNTKDDNQIILEYTMTFGAHNAHSY